MPSAFAPRIFRSAGLGLVVCLLALVTATVRCAAAEESANPWSRIGGPTHGNAQVIGATDHGCIAGAEALPLDGPGYEVARPERKRFFGHPDMIDFIEGLARRSQAAGLPLLYIGDMAQPRGGPMPESSHHSHETGLDADFWFTLGPHYSPTAVKQALPDPRSMLEPDRAAVDPARFGRDQMTLLRFALSDPRVDRIYVDRAIKLALCRGVAGATYFGTEWLRRLQIWPKHDDHFHVRLRCPESSPDCEPQAPVPEGDGCADLANGVSPSPPPRVPSPPAHEVACRRVLATGSGKAAPGSRGGRVARD